MAEWIPTEEFEKTEYGRLNKILDGENYFGKLDKTKLSKNYTVVSDPKDGRFGIIKDNQGNPVGKVDLKEFIRIINHFRGLLKSWHFFAPISFE